MLMDMVARRTSWYFVKLWEHRGRLWRPLGGLQPHLNFMATSRRWAGVRIANWLRHARIVEATRQKKRKIGVPSGRHTINWSGKYEKSQWCTWVVPMGSLERQLCLSAMPKNGSYAGQRTVPSMISVARRSTLQGDTEANARLCF